MKTILVSGAAGFIGFHVSQHLLRRGDKVVGVDNLNAYYSVALKQDRLEQLKACNNFTFHEGNIQNQSIVEAIFLSEPIDIVCHLAAQAGVRYSIINPYAYVESNLVGFQNIIQAAVDHKVKNFVYASSSSVYGGNIKTPFSEEDRVDNPVSLYAATKKSNELVAHSYSHIHHLPTTGLRFFTVYGPWGRPDMALFLFTQAILKNEPIELFNYGKMQRDFTYVDDIVKGVVAAIDCPHPCEIFNLGNNKPIQLIDFVNHIEKRLGKIATKELLPMQPGDVPSTCADIEHSKRLLGFSPQVDITEGIGLFLDWYLNYYKV